MMVILMKMQVLRIQKTKQLSCTFPQLSCDSVFFTFFVGEKSNFFDVVNKE